MKKSMEFRQEREELLNKLKAVEDLLAHEKRDMTDDEKGKFDSYCSRIEALHKEIEREERLERAEDLRFKAAQQPALKVERETQVENRDNRVARLAGEEYRSAFVDYIRYGATKLRPDQKLILDSEIRALAVGTGSAGGYLVPQGFSNAIEKALKDFGGMRAASRILPTGSGNDIPWPTVNDTTQVGELLGENTQAASQDAAFGQTVLKAYKYSSKKVPVSIELLQDSGVDLEAVLGQLLGERIARIQNQHFTTGTGSGQPSGVVTGAASGKVGTTGQTLTVIYDDLVDLVHSVDPAYRPGSRFMLADSSLKVCMKLKDSQGRYYFQPDSTGSESKTILGYPYTINQDVAAMAANAKSILFGDFSKYIIREILGFSLLRLEEVAADYGQVVFIAFARADGRLLDAGTNPIKYYQNSAT